MSSNGDCFIVLPPHCGVETLCFGRNSESSEGVAQEVVFYEKDTSVQGKSDGGAAPELAGDDRFRLILQKPRPETWGGDYGANERNVCVGVTWAADELESGNGHLSATDIVRFALATSATAASAVDHMGLLLEAHAADGAKSNFVVCDAKEAWVVSGVGKLWAARRFVEGFQRFSSGGLTVTTAFDKSCAELGDALKTLGLWNGEGDLNFAACFEAIADPAASAWSDIVEPAGDATYTLTSMFETLRASTKAATARSASVSVLTQAGGGGGAIHWFTATPNPIESVFKPFVFAPNPKISPLTQVLADGDGDGDDDGGLTLLHKLHAQRKPNAVADLKALEAAAVDAVNKYLAEHPEVDEELDELMKDCVEAEVKFYR